jgi:hypothetical protein
MVKIKKPNKIYLYKQILAPSHILAPSIAKYAVEELLFTKVKVYARAVKSAEEVWKLS